MTLFSSLVVGVELTIAAPSEIKLNEEFSVSIDADLSEQFDVKIFIHSSSDEQVSRSEYISEIFSPAAQEWKDSWFYIEGSFPEVKTYTLRTVESPGERNICLRLRKTGGQTSYIKCAQITVAGEENNSSESEEEQEEKSETNDEENQENNSEQESASKGNQTQQYLAYVPEKTEQKQEKIILNSPPVEIETADVLITKDEKIRRWIVYGFLAFTIFLLILIGLRKL